MPFPVKQAFVGTVSLPWSTLFTFCQFMKYAVYIWPEKNCFDPQMSKDEQNFQTRNFWHKKINLATVKKYIKKDLCLLGPAMFMTQGWILFLEGGLSMIKTWVKVKIAVNGAIVR